MGAGAIWLLPITSGVPSRNNERLHCFAFLLSKSLPDDDQHIFPFLDHFAACDRVYYGNIGSQMSGVLFAMSCTTTFTEIPDSQRL